MWQTVLGIAFGGLISAAVGWFFYRRGSRDLERTSNAYVVETRKLKDLTLLMMSALQEAGLAEWSCDPRMGDPIGHGRKFKASVEAEAQMEANLVVEHAKGKEQPAA